MYRARLVAGKHVVAERLYGVVEGAADVGYGALTQQQQQALHQPQHRAGRLPVGSRQRRQGVIGPEKLVSAVD